MDERFHASGPRRRRLALAIFVTCVTFVGAVHAKGSSSGTKDGSEAWGYVVVRPGAHMFWWLYNSPYHTNSNWPLILWLQGGPGASGTGLGNFEEIGPLSVELLPRKETWLKKADLLFVDSPVGTGFSYVDNASLILKTDAEVVGDLVTFLEILFRTHSALQKSPLFIVGESYGGKHASLLGLALSSSGTRKRLNINLKGVALGDSWISPVDFVLTWGPVLKTFSRVDDNQESIISSQAQSIKAQLNEEQYKNATKAWANLEQTVLSLSNRVDFYNLLNDEVEGSSITSVLTTSIGKNSFMNFEYYSKRLKLKTRKQSTPDLASIMNGPVRKKLQIIPSAVSWTSSSAEVFWALENDFMKDIVAQVDELLSAGVNLTIYSGQVDLICATLGMETWVQKLKWPGLKAFNIAPRYPFHCNSSNKTDGFVKSYENLSLYWILLAGHMVPTDQPCTALEMIGRITG